MTTPGHHTCRSTVCESRRGPPPPPVHIAGRRKSVPVINVRGNHYDVGFDTGRVFSGVIRNFLAGYQNLRDFEKEYHTDAGRKIYEQTLANMRKRFPYYVKEMQGTADGAGVPFYQLFLLQMDDLIEHANDSHVPGNDTGGCSTVAINLPGTGVLGHTEDAFQECLNHFYIMSAHVLPSAEDAAAGAIEEKFTSLCYAGHMPGYTMGNNLHGLVYSINTLSPMALKFGNTPRTFITRALLSARNSTDAERILVDEGLGIGNGFSLNMFWIQHGQRTLVNVEIAPDFKANRSQIVIYKYDNEPLIHTNIYHRLPVTEVIGPIVDSSKARLTAIHAHKPPRNRQDIQEILSDRTNPGDFTVFQDKNDTIIRTITAGIFDLEKSTWSLYIDAPNNSEPVAVIPLNFQSNV